MARTATMTAPLSFGDSSAGSLGGLRWMAPALIGLGGPMIVGLMLYPGLADGARFAAVAGLGLLAALATSAYTLSVLSPGDVTGLIVDPGRGELVLTQQSAFATKRRDYIFADVRDVRMAKGYDDDGYVFEAPELELTDGTIYALPATITREDIAVARQAIGLAAAKR